jgi:signal recognition particle GTPase
MGLFKKKQDKRVEEITAWAKAYLEEKTEREAVPPAVAAARMGEAAEPLETVEVASESAAAASGPVRADEGSAAQAPALPREAPTVVPTDDLPAEATATEDRGETVLEPALAETVGWEPTIAVEEEVPAEPTALTFFERLRSGLSKTRDGLVGRMDRLFSSKAKIDGEMLAELEQILIESDIGVQHSMALIAKLEEEMKTCDLDRPESIKNCIQDEIRGVLSADGRQDHHHRKTGPAVYAGR